MLRILSLGAGVQSTVLFYMIQEGVFADDAPTVAIFADTKDEPKAVYAHLEKLEIIAEQSGKCKIIRVGRETGIYEETLETVHGKAGKRFASLPYHVRNLNDKKSILKRQCTKEWKLDAIRREVREQMKLHSTTRAEVWIGITLDEKHRAKPSRYVKTKNYYPFLFNEKTRMTRHECISWLTSHEYEVPVRSSCAICPFHGDDEWKWLKESDPEAFERACKLDEQTRKLPRIDGEVFLHRSLTPLREVDFNVAKEFRPNLFTTQECEGMCGL
jgi:hypothetical protein